MERVKTMKVYALDYELTGFRKTLEIEHEGKIYYADLIYDSNDGYDLSFRDQNKNAIEMPEWAVEWEDKQQYGLDSLEYKLDCDSGNWEFAHQREIEVA